MIPLLGKTAEELRELMVVWGQPAWRGNQLYDALYRQRIRDPQRITALPATVRERVKAECVAGWPEIHRQVKVRGAAARTSVAESLGYFMRRPRDSQLGAWVSNQSQAISSRAVLEQKFTEMKQKFSAGEIPLPSFWGGYRVSADAIEFWQGQESRLHDRFLYTRAAGAWHLERLAP